MAEGWPELAVIGFHPEAYDTAFRVLNELRGFTVTVVQTSHPEDPREPFDAELMGASFDDDGDLVVHVAPWDEAAGRGDKSRPMQFSAYDELERIEVV